MYKRLVISFFLIGTAFVSFGQKFGYIDTDYDAKAAYALKELETKDFVYLHVEAPDEAAHSGSLENKLKAIEDFDKKIVGAVFEGDRDRVDAVLDWCRQGPPHADVTGVDATWSEYTGEFSGFNIAFERDT